MTEPQPSPERETLSPQEEAAALRCNPWEMDDSDYRELSDKFIVTRKPSECAICFEAIPAGARCRAKTEVMDGVCKTFRFCLECCWCMAHQSDDFDGFDDDDDSPYMRLEQRYALGRKNAEAARAGGAK